MRCQFLATTVFTTGLMTCCWPVTGAIAQLGEQPIGSPSPVEPIEFPDEIPTVETPAHPVSMELEETVETTTPDAVAPTPPVATWRLFTSEDERFRVAMPSPPANYSFTGNPDPESRSRVYMQVQLVNSIHMEIYAAAFVESADFSAEQSAEDCALSLGNVDYLAETRSLNNGEHSGAEALFVKPDDGLQVSRCFIVNDRAYMLTATRELFDAGSGLQPISADSQTANDDNDTAQSSDLQLSSTMQTFFDSFEILNDETLSE